MLRRQTIFAMADSRARLSEAQRPDPLTPTRRQRSALAREMRRLGWHTTPLARKPR